MVSLGNLDRKVMASNARVEISHLSSRDQVMFTGWYVGYPNQGTYPYLALKILRISFFSLLLWDTCLWSLAKSLLLWPQEAPSLWKSCVALLSCELLKFSRPFLISWGKDFLSLFKNINSRISIPSLKYVPRIPAETLWQISPGGLHDVLKTPRHCMPCVCIRVHAWPNSTWIYIFLFSILIHCHPINMFFKFKRSVQMHINLQTHYKFSYTYESLVVF